MRGRDQAACLRRIMRPSGRVEANGPQRNPRASVLILASPEKGTGKTELALALGAALARNRRRGCVVHCGASGREESDEPGGFRSPLAIHTPFGFDRMTIDPSSDSEGSHLEKEGIFQAAARVGERYDHLILDGLPEMPGPFLGMMDERDALWLVVTAEVGCLVSAYAWLKGTCLRSDVPRPAVVVNRAVDVVDGAAAAARLTSFVHRTLGIPVSTLGVIPYHRRSGQSTGCEEGLIASSQCSRAARVVAQLANGLCERGIRGTRWEVRSGSSRSDRGRSPWIRK